MRPSEPRRCNICVTMLGTLLTASASGKAARRATSQPWPPFKCLGSSSDLSITVMSCGNGMFRPHPVRERPLLRRSGHAIHQRCILAAPDCVTQSGWDVSLARPLGRATAPTFPVRPALLSQGPPVGVRLGRTIAIIANVVFILRSAQLAVVRPVAVRAMGPLIMAPAVAAMRMTRAVTFGISIVAVAPLRRWSRLLGKILVGRRRQHRDAPVGEPLDALELAALTAVAEGDGDARGAGPRGAADAMDVALGVGRQLVVDDVGHALHVDAAGRKVGRDQHAGAAAAESIERALAGVLRLVAVDRLRPHATAIERLGDAVGAALGAGEHNHPFKLAVGQEMAQERTLAGGVDEVD